MAPAKMEIVSENNYLSDDQEEEQMSQKKRKTKTEHSKKSSKKFKKELYKQPTIEELNQMRETENVNNNLFRLQLKELLAEIKIKDKYIKKFQQWYNRFVNFITNLPEYEETTASNFHKSKKLRKPDFECDQDVNLHFLRPTSCQITGLYALKSAVGPTLNVDLTIELPKKCLYQKDYLNYRYLTKRYYYLLYVTAEIEKANICSEISLSHPIDFNVSPVLKIVPDVSSNINIKLSVVPPEDYFNYNRFLPNKNNLKTIFNQESEYGTSHYNSLLLQNIRANVNHKLVLSALQDFQNALDGLQLLIVWLKQRELYDVAGINDEFLMQLLMYLLNENYVNKYTSSYQIVRNIWLFISKSDWQNEPISICKDVTSDTFSLFKEYFDVTFLDSSGCYNVTSFLTLEIYLKLKYEAKLAVQYLDDNMLNSFDCLFMKKMPFVVQYDAVLRFKCIEHFPNEITEQKEKHLFLQNFRTLAIAKTILKKLKFGINKRSSCLMPIFVKNEICFHPRDSVRKTTTDLIIGINLDLDHAFCPLELGPSPHDPKVKDFLDFWGKQSTLRRFPDGTTCETVYFETKTAKDKREITKTIIELIANEKIQLNYQLLFDQLEQVLINPKFIPPFPAGTNEEVSLKIISTADELNAKLRALELPLEITNISGNADVFNYTKLFPTIPSLFQRSFDRALYTKTQNNMIVFDESAKNLRCPVYVEPVQNIIQLALHSKWPNDLQAVRNIKTAFLLKIAELLGKFNIVTHVTREHLDVLYRGVVFRYKIYHPKEIALVKKIVNNAGVVSYKENKESAALEKELNIGPKICSALKGIQSQYPSYGPSTALAKRWLRSHLLDDFYFPDTVINLLNASLYLNSAPFAVPTLPQIGFLRFLKFLFETDWSVQIVVVNFNQELNRETIGEVEMNFYQHREKFPNVFILMPYDDCKSVFTKNSPTKEVLRRVSVLAKSCYEGLCNHLNGAALNNVQVLFTPNMEGFNAVIHLNPKRNTQFYQNVHSNIPNKISLPNVSTNLNMPIPIVDFNPVNLYLKDLRRNYGRFALFFHDTYGGTVIGVLWKPEALQEVKFKISQVPGRVIENDTLVTNFNAILHDFYLLGKGIVEKIDKK